MNAQKSQAVPGMLVRNIHTGAVARIVTIKPDPFWFPAHGGTPQQMAYVCPDDNAFGDYWSLREITTISQPAALFDTVIAVGADGGKYAGSVVEVRGEIVAVYLWDEDVVEEMHSSHLMRFMPGQGVGQVAA